MGERSSVMGSLLAEAISFSLKVFSSRKKRSDFSKVRICSMSRNSVCAIERAGIWR